MIEFTNADVGAKFVIDGCDANVHISDSSVGQLDSLCFSAAGSSSVTMLNSAVDHSTTNSAIYLHQTNGVFIDVVVTEAQYQAMVHTFCMLTFQLMLS